MKPGGIGWLLGFVGLLMLASGGLQAKERYAFEQTVQRDRFWTVVRSLRCLVCQNESLADSQASLAVDLKNRIYGWVKQGYSKARIEKELTRRYSDFILLKPRFSWPNFVLWVAPWFVFIVGLVVIVVKNR